MINQSFLNEIATETNSKIAKVVLNGTYEITAFDVKSVSTSVIRLQYTVPNGSVVNITKIEIKKANGSIISSNTVFVPITTDTIIKHDITVGNKEA